MLPRPSQRSTGAIQWNAHELIATNSSKWVIYIKPKLLVRLSQIVLILAVKIIIIISNKVVFKKKKVSSNIDKYIS